MTHRSRRGCAALIVSVMALGSTSLAGAAAGLTGLFNTRFVAVPASMLPIGRATYYDAACPTETSCHIVGFASGHGIVTTTSDGGKTWSTLVVANSNQLVAISCPSASVCYAGGGRSGGGSGIIATRNAGSTWSTQPVPAGSIVSSIGCGSTNSCIAVGSPAQAQASQSTVIATHDGGASWAFTGFGGSTTSGIANGLTTVRCLDAGHCWAAGPGAWFTSDLGSTWHDISPPPEGCPTGAGTCIATSTVMIDVEFQTASDGWLIGGNQCGGQGVTQCPGAAYHTVNGGASWTLSRASQGYPFGWQIACQSSACLLVAQAFTHSVILGTNANGTTWSPLQTVATTINALACTPMRSFCVAAGGYQGRPALLTAGVSRAPTLPASGSTGGGGGSAPGSVVSTVGSSLATPTELSGSPISLLASALLALALILLVTFPSHLFNRTYDENHERIRAWWERRLPWSTRLRAPMPSVRSRVRAGVSFAAMLLVGGVLAALLDPRFGLNLRSFALFVGAMLALIAGSAVTGAAAGVYRRARNEAGAWQLRALPTGLVVAGFCVLVSRLTNFQPGYLYGLIGGVAFASTLSQREEGHVVAVASASTLVVSIIAWLLWVPVSTRAAADPAGFGWALLENFLAALFVSGMVGLLIGLVPLRFLPGEKLASWSRSAWALMFGLASLAVIEVMLRPQSTSARVTSVPIWTTVGLFLGFGAASVMFWAYFRVRNRLEPSVARD